MALQRRSRKFRARSGPGLLAVLAILAVLAPGFERPLGAATSERVVNDPHTGLAISGFDPVAYFTDAKPIAGTRLIREWQGVQHCVTVQADGYEWQGRPYKSLSAVARAITGTRWNGLVFFGVKNQRGFA